MRQPILIKPLGSIILSKPVEQFSEKQPWRFGTVQKEACQDIGQSNLGSGIMRLPAISSRRQELIPALPPRGGTGCACSRARKVPAATRLRFAEGHLKRPSGAIDPVRHASPQMRPRAHPNSRDAVLCPDMTPSGFGVISITMPSVRPARPASASGSSPARRRASRGMSRWSFVSAMHRRGIPSPRTSPATSTSPSAAASTARLPASTPPLPARATSAASGRKERRCRDAYTQRWPGTDRQTLVRAFHLRSRMRQNQRQDLHSKDNLKALRRFRSGLHPRRRSPGSRARCSRRGRA